MLITIIHTRLFKAIILGVLGLLLKDKYSKKCAGCEREIDIEDCFFNNSCEFCGASQGYDRECYDNSNLNYWGFRR